MGLFGPDEDENDQLLAQQPTPDDQNKFVFQPGQPPVPPAPEPAAAPVDPMQYINAKYGDEIRAKIQKQNEEEAAGPNWLAGLSAFGAGLQGGNAGEAGQRFLASQQAKRDKRLSDFDQGKAQALANVKAGHDEERYQQEKTQYTQGQDKLKREMDPNSDESKLAQNIVTGMNLKVDPELLKNMTAAKFKELGPMFEKQYNVQERALAAKEHNTAIAASNEARKALADERTSKKMDEQQDKDAKALDSHLGKGWASRGGQAGQIQGKINAAEAAEVLIDQGRKQPGGLDSRQIEELAQSTAKLLGGGATASGRVEALVPHTWTGRAQSLKEFLSNEPTGQQMQKFVDRMAETVSREKELAQTQQKQHQVSGLAQFERLKKSNPDLYSQILQSHGIDPSMVDEKGQYKKGGAPEGMADTVRVIGPKGDVHNIPKDKVKAAIAAGGKLADDKQAIAGEE